MNEAVHSGKSHKRARKREASTSRNGAKKIYMHPKRLRDSLAMKTKNIRNLSSPHMELPLIRLALNFNSDFYMRQVESDDLVESPFDPLMHYLSFGWKSGLDANPHFSGQAYLEANEDVKSSQIDPLYHYIYYGSRERRHILESAKGSGIRARDSLRALGEEAAIRADLILITEELPGYGPSGGIGSAVEEFASLCLENGKMPLVLWCPHEGVDDSTIRKAELNWERRGVQISVVRVLDVCNDHSPQSRSYAVYKHLSQLNCQARVFHFPEYGGLGFHCLMAKKHGTAFHQVEIVVHLHGSTRWAVELDREPFSQPNQLVSDFLERECMRLADRLISMSQFLVDWYVKNGMLENGQRVNVARSLMRSSTSYSQETLSDERKRPVIVIAHSAVKKGLKNALSEIDKLPDDALSCMSGIYFVGSFGFIDNIHSALYVARTAKDWQIPWTLLPGFTRDQVGALLEVLADPIVVIPSPIENSPFAVLEPVMRNLQTVSSGIGGGREIFSTDTAAQFFFDPNSRGSMAESISYCLHNPQSRPKLAESDTQITAKWLDFLSPREPKSRDDISEWPSVTVAITHFERLDKLVEAVSVIQRIEYQGVLKVLIIDDGSRDEDDVMRVANLMESSRCKVIIQENSYLGSARNRALAEAETEFIMYIDDDDLLMPHTVSTLARALLFSGADIVGAFPTPFRADLRQITALVKRSQGSRMGFIPVGGPLSLSPLMNLMGGPVIMSKVATLRNLNGYTEEYGVGYEDFELLVRAKANGLRVEIHPEPLYHYEVQKVAMLSSTSPEQGNRRAIASLKQGHVQSELFDLASLIAGQSARTVSEVRRVMHPDGNHLNSEIKALNQAVSLSDQLEKLNNLSAHDEFSMLSSVMALMAATQKKIDLYLRELHAVEQRSVESEGKHRRMLMRKLLIDSKRGNELGELLSIVDERMKSQVNFDDSEVELLAQIDWAEFGDSLNSRYSQFLLRILSQASPFAPDSSFLARLTLASKIAKSLGRQSDFDECQVLVNVIEEHAYRVRYPEMAEGIPSYFNSGLEHFVKFGKREGRVGFEYSLYLKELSGSPVSELDFQDQDRLEFALHEMTSTIEFQWRDNSLHFLV